MDSMDILQDIIDLDRAAAARAMASVEEERRLSDESGEQSAKVNREMLDEERKKVREYCDKKDKQLSQKLREAESVRNERCRSLDESFNSLRTQWKSEIIKRITGE